MNRFLLALAVLLVLLLPAWLAVELIPSAGALRATVQETLTGETPEARIATYVNAVRRGDERAALAAWELPTWELLEGHSEKLGERRVRVTRELIAAGIRPSYHIVHVQWWRTCCEPGITPDSRSAGGARIDVQFADLNGEPLRYRFDLFTRGGAYWGAAMGYPPRAWVLRDLYPADQQPLFWRFLYESVIRSLDTRPTPLTMWD